jgi:LysM repeat protein
MTREWYAFLFDLEATDDKGWAYGLKRAGYATEKDYPQRLLKLIDDYQLQQYSLFALGMPTNSSNKTFAKTSKNSKKQSVINKTESETITASVPTTEVIKKSIEATEPEDKNETEVVEKKQSTSEEVKNASPYPADVFTINHSKVIYAEAGVSLLSIANKYDISLSRLLEFNELSETDILTTDQLIFLEKKLKKGATDFHVTNSNESLTLISQKEGVRLESLLEYNKMKKDTVIRQGDKIYLRTATTIANNSVKQPK